MAGSGAFVERGVTLAAVSTDDPDDSRDFAKRYGIEFPLVSDVGGEISKAFVGIDTADVTIPGVVVIKRDGSIVFRQVATSKDDRLTAKQLLDAVDRSLGTKGSYVESFRPALARMQLRSEVGVGQIRYPATSFTGFAGNGSIVVPLNRYLIAGAVDVNMNLSGSLGLRVPFLHDTPFGAQPAFVQGNLAICPQSDVDHFRFTLPSTKSVQIIVAQEIGAGALTGSILNAGGSTIGNTTPFGPDQCVCLTNLPAASYFVRVSASDQINYRVEMKEVSAVQCPAAPACN